MKKRHFYLLAAAWGSFCVCLGFFWSEILTQIDQQPRNVILFIGDGMGLSHITAGKTVNGTLNLERFKIAGFLTTHAHDAFVPDSASSATALATGQKTLNGALAVSPDKKALKTVVEWAEETGKSTGIVVTCPVTHATPAAFVAHSDSRDNNALIARDIVKSGLDVLFGGGWDDFRAQPGVDGPSDGHNDLMAALERRMTVVQSKEGFLKLGAGCQRVAGLFAAGSLPDAENRIISLAEMTQKAIRILSQNRKGFFLMVEGSHIDWAGHQNNPDYLIKETVDLDRAVGAGLDFAEADGQTLVIVTSDHETGGFALHDGSIKDRTLTASGFTTNQHTATMTPLFAFGPGSKVFGGIQDNTFVGETMIKAMR